MPSTLHTAQCVAAKLSLTEYSVSGTAYFSSHKLARVYEYGVAQPPKTTHEGNLTIFKEFEPPLSGSTECFANKIKVAVTAGRGGI